MQDQLTDEPICCNGNCSQGHKCPMYRPVAFDFLAWIASEVILLTVTGLRAVRRLL